MQCKIDAIAIIKAGKQLGKTLTTWAQIDPKSASAYLKMLETESQRYIPWVDSVEYEKTLDALHHGENE